MGSPSFPETFVVSHHYLCEVLELFLFFGDKVELPVIFVYSSPSHLEKQHLVNFLTLNLEKKKSHCVVQAGLEFICILD